MTQALYLNIQFNDNQIQRILKQQLPFFCILLIEIQLSSLNQYFQIQLQKNLIHIRMEDNSFQNSTFKKQEQQFLRDFQLPTRNIERQEKFSFSFHFKKIQEEEYFLHILLTISALILLLFISSSCLFNSSSKTIVEPVKYPVDEDLVSSPSIMKLAKIYQTSYKIQQTFKKIFWIIIKVEFESLPLYDYLQVMNQKRYAESSGFEVRIVDPITIYEWITQDKAKVIAEIKMKGLVSINIIHLLRLAVLLEHGGVSIFGSNYIFIDKLDWLDQLFQKSSKIQSVLFFRNLDNLKVYDDQIIISKKNSALIRTIFSSLLQYVHTGNWEYKSEYSFGEYNNKSEVFVVENPFQNLVTFLANFRYSGEQFDEVFLSISLNKENGIIRQYQDVDKILNEKQKFKSAHSNISIIELPLITLKSQILKVLAYQKSANIHKDSILLQDIIKIPGNDWLWKGVNTVRKVNFCVISLKPLSIDYQKQLSSSIESLKKQHFTNWKAIYFVENLSEQKKIFSNLPLITIARATQYQGLNLQRAATKYCEHHDVAFLLDYNELLGQQKSLQKVASMMQSTKYYAASLTIKTDSTIQEPQILKFTPRKINNPNKQYISQLSNNMRIFSISTYKLIPRGQLQDFVEGRFYDKELALLTMVEMGRSINQCMNNQYSYQLRKKQYDGHSVPREIAPPINTWIMSQTLKQINLKSREYISKFSVDSICHHYKGYYHSQMDISYPFHKNFLYNNGKQFQSIDDRKNLTQKIPKIIHQIKIVQEPISSNKTDISRMLKLNHKDYNYYLWTKENITRNNFPITFDLLQNILQHLSKDKRNNNILLSDLMRLQILHNYGGFYIDNNYYAFNKSALDMFLTYKFVFPSYLIPHHRQLRENSFIGAEKGCKNIKKLLDYRLLSSRDIFNSDVRIPFGPLYFALAATPEQQYDEDIIQPPYEFIYPYSPQYSDDSGNLCELDQKDQTTEVLLRGKFRYSKDCPQKYYWAFGIKLYKQSENLIYKV